MSRHPAVNAHGAEKHELLNALRLGGPGNLHGQMMIYLLVEGAVLGGFLLMGDARYMHHPVIALKGVFRQRPAHVQLVRLHAAFQQRGPNGLAQIASRPGDQYPHYGCPSALFSLV